MYSFYGECWINALINTGLFFVDDQEKEESQVKLSHLEQETFRSADLLKAFLDQHMA